MTFKSKALFGALVLGIGAAACGGGASGIQGSTGPVTTAGAVTLSSQQTVASFAPAGGISGTLTYATGSGTVTVTASTTPPNGVLPITSDPQAKPTNASVLYLTLSGTAAMNGLPAVALTLSSITGSYYDDYFNGTSWSIIGQGSSAAPVVSFPQNAKSENLTAGSVYLAVYTGPAIGVPPTSAPVCVPGNAVCDPGFESGTVNPYYNGSSMTATNAPVAGSWTQCSINPASSPSPHPASAYTPVPGSVPAATISSFVTTIATPNPAPTASPLIPTVTPVHSGNFAALLGGVYNGYTLEDFAYNGLCQTVTIPQGSTLSMYIWDAGNQSATYADFDVDLLDANNNYVTNLYDENKYGTSDDSAYRQLNLDVSGYGGQTYNLFIGLWAKGSGAYYGAYTWVDDMYLGTNPPTQSAARRSR